MILQTGGWAWGAIFTRSRSCWTARSSASAELTIPSWLPSTPIRRTSLSLISSLIWCSLLLMTQHLQNYDKMKNGYRHRSVPALLHTVNAIKCWPFCVSWRWERIKSYVVYQVIILHSTVFVKQLTLFLQFHFNCPSKLLFVPHHYITAASVCQYGKISWHKCLFAL